MSRFTILHNPHDRLSRWMVAQHLATPDVEILDWNDDLSRDAWLAAGGTMAVAGFPSVAYAAPEYDELGSSKEGGPVDVRATRPAGPAVVLCIERPDLELVKAHAARADALAAVTWVERLGPLVDVDELAKQTELARPYLEAAAGDELEELTRRLDAATVAKPIAGAVATPVPAPGRSDPTG